MSPIGHLWGDRCHFCGGTDVIQELRPYGPGGALVCHGCVTDPAHPEREAAAQAMFEAEQRQRQQARAEALAAHRQGRQVSDANRLRVFEPPSG